ncbi:hypothetical protein BC830DRAFT_1104321 [Chytriomyces sp. MP71]|nr:hypothetical protein BC830DRAFT_1104321 [Chytriomyces sp. MP71]
MQIALRRAATMHLAPATRLGSSGAYNRPHIGGEPGGYFLADPGNKAQKGKYFWEPVYLWGYIGGTAVFLTAYFYSPNKSPSQAAKIEAYRRIAESGETFGWPLPPDCE